MQQVVEEFNPLDTFKNSGNYGERQLGGHSRYKINCRLPSFHENHGVRYLREPNKYQTVILETVRSKETEFDWVTL